MTDKLKAAVKALQEVLNEGGSKLVVDGVPGPQTTKALHDQAFASSAAAPVPSMGGDFTRAKLAIVAENLCKQNIRQGSAKHLMIIHDFIPVFGKGNWSWCAATDRYECVEAGLNMPIKCPSRFGYTFAFVEAWQQWAIEKDFYHDNDGKFEPEPGDIVVYDWDQKSINEVDHDQENHIGVHLRKVGNLYQAAEGNTGGATGIKNRPSKNIQGWIRIPDHYKF